MNGELSNGLPRLATSGNQIIETTTSTPLILRGVNRSGLEYSGPDEQGFLSGASISRAEIKTIVQGWGCKIVRVPLNQDFVLNGRGGRSGEDYRLALDQLISWISRFGAYTLLDLQWLDAEKTYGGNRNFVAPLPNSRSIEMWALLANRFKDESAVLYDLFTEPHDRLSDDPNPLNKEDGTTYPPRRHEVTMTEWQPWATTLIEAIRRESPEAMVFVSGTNWGYDLRGMPLNVANAVYSTHVYSNKGNNWSEAFGNLSARVPVFVGEFGIRDTDNSDFGDRLLSYIRQLGIGWTAWSWFDDPFIVDRYAPTSFGAAIRNQLVG